MPRLGLVSVSQTVFGREVNELRKRYRHHTCVALDRADSAAAGGPDSSDDMAAARRHAVMSLFYWSLLDG